MRYATWGILRLVWEVRPDLLLSGIFHLSFAILLMRWLFPPSARILVRQNASPRLTWKGLSAPIGSSIYRLLYGTADGIICQNDAMAEELHALLPSFERIHVLLNPVDLRSIRVSAATHAPRWTGPGPHLLAIGRLSPEKGFDLLLQAFRRVQVQFRGATLAILGSGEEERKLRSQCADLGLQSAVNFMGYVDEPSTWFPGATLFVCTSKSDAMPNAVLEAAAAGLPIVCTPASRGLTALLKEKQGVWLAEQPSADSIGESLLGALKSLRPHQRFEHAWIERHDLEESIRQYEDLILHTTRNENACSTSLSSFQR